MPAVCKPNSSVHDRSRRRLGTVLDEPVFAIGAISPAIRGAARCAAHLFATSGRAASHSEHGYQACRWITHVSQSSEASAVARAIRPSVVHGATNSGKPVSNRYISAASRRRPYVLTPRIRDGQKAHARNMFYERSGPPRRGRTAGRQDGRTAGRQDGSTGVREYGSTAVRQCGNAALKRWRHALGGTRFARRSARDLAGHGLDAAFAAADEAETSANQLGRFVRVGTFHAAGIDGRHGEVVGVTRRKVGERRGGRCHVGTTAQGLAVVPG